MSETILFMFGLFVTLVVVGAIGAIWWAAVEDGRVEERGGPEMPERA